MRAFYGTDLHWKKQYRGMINVVHRETATREVMLEAMRAGDYVGVKDDFELPSSGRLAEELLSKFGRANERYHRRRSLLKRAKRLTGRLGLKIPAPIKAQLRRVF
jgi:hypothetical protein